MSECIIGLGKCSYFYIYILCSLMLSSFKNYISSSNVLIMNDHKLVRNIYKFTSYIFLGILFNSILNRNLQSKEKNEINRKQSTTIHFIFYNALKISNKNNFLLIIICSIYTIHPIFIELLSFFKLDSLVFWTIRYAFALIFTNYYFPQSIYIYIKNFL